MQNQKQEPMNTLINLVSFWKIISLFKDDISFPINYLTGQKKNNFFKYLDNKKKRKTNSGWDGFRFGGPNGPKFELF